MQLLCDVLQRKRHSQAAADAEGGHSSFRVALEHLVQKRDRDSRAGAADGMADRDGSAVYIDLVAVEIQFAVAGEHLGGEGFIQFDQAKILQP